MTKVVYGHIDTQRTQGEVKTPNEAVVNILYKFILWSLKMQILDMKQKCGDDTRICLDKKKFIANSMLYNEIQACITPSDCEWYRPRLRTRLVLPKEAELRKIGWLPFIPRILGYRKKSSIKNKIQSNPVISNSRGNKTSFDIANDSI